MNILVTSILVTYNDSKYLSDCLKSLSFCHEKIIVDLGSSDNTLSIAKKHNCKIFNAERVQIIEHIRSKAISYASNDWIIFPDPDEIMPDNLGDKIRDLVVNNYDLGIFFCQIQYYFKDKPLIYTRWGGQKKRLLGYNRQRIDLSDIVHRGPQLKESYSRYNVSNSSKDFIIKHYWIDSYSQFFEKHKRYLKFEGKSKYEKSFRFSLSKLIQNTWKEFYFCFWTKRGVKGGFDGIMLSFLWAWYTFMAWLSLYKYEKKLKRPQ